MRVKFYINNYKIKYSTYAIFLCSFSRKCSLFIFLKGPMQRQIRFGTVRKPKGVDDLPVTLQKSYKNVKWWTGAPKKGKIFLKAQKVDLMSNFKDQLKQIWTVSL